MTMQVQEITNFKSGIDVSLDPILAPADAFINLKNGFVHRGVLQSRAGFRGFATGNSSTTRVVSRVTNEIASETADTGDGTSDYSFTLANTQVERTNIVIKAPTEGLTVTFAYNPETRAFAATGNTGAGTNSMNYQTGAVNVSFSGNIGVGNNINVTYNYHPDLAIMGIDEYVQTDGTRDLIVLDQDFPYIWDGTNNDFDRIAFAGTATDFTGSTDNFFTFQNWRLHSQGAVPTPPGPLTFSDLLIFTNNVDAPYVYNGTNVQLVSDLVQFQAPSEGALNKALHVLSYGERLIWLRPTLGTDVYGQGVLWGPINDNSGNALDYQATGSGILSAATTSIITGFHFLGDTLIVHFENNMYALELTDDAFRPFNWTKLEDERGVEPTHGSVGYLGTVEAPGRLGILSTDGRIVRRADDKIPFFTRNQINPDLISHVFGEEMEEDSQFWWTYPDFNTPDLTTSNKVLVKNFEEDNYSIYDIAISVLNKTEKGTGIVWNNLQEVFGGVAADDPDGITEKDIDKKVANVIWNKWGFLGSSYKTVFGEHNGFIFATGETFTDGSALIVPNASNAATAITLGSPTVVETEYHHFRVGDVVQFNNIAGTVELNGLQHIITAITASSISVNIDSTDFTTWTGGGEITKPINFEAEFVPFNPFRPEGQRVYIGKMDFLIKSATGKYTIDFFEDRSHDTWTHSTQPKTTYTFSSDSIDGIDRWFSIFVDNTADFHRWKISQFQTKEQIAIKSIRVFFKPGGESNI